MQHELKKTAIGARNLNGVQISFQTGLAGNTMILSVLYYGGVMVSHDHISVGNLSAFLLYAAYIGVSIGGLTSFYAELNRGLGASTRLWQLVDRQPAIPITGRGVAVARLTFS